MSEHWKSTPKYWCKHCSCYVRDTRLEKQNHEATARHQGALKRSLRNLHHAHEREEREKARAQQEVARLNGVVSHGPASAAARPARTTPAAPSESELKKQREQLAELGVAVPSAFRADMAVAGKWTVTGSRVVASEGDDVDSATAAAVATGVRKREEASEEQKEEEEALQRLFKKPRTWGRDSKTAAHDDDPELDALLSGTTIPLKRRPGDEDGRVKEEEATAITEEEDTAIKKEGDTAIKKEEDTAIKKKEGEDPSLDTNEARSRAVKEEPDTTGQGLAPAAETARTDGGSAAVVFKKRKAKGLRTR